jgi:uncharacterized membrane protein
MWRSIARARAHTGTLLRAFAVIAMLALPALAWLARVHASAIPAGALTLATYAPAVGFNLAMAAVFGASLRRGEPLVMRFARMEGAEPTLDVARYCRRLTAVWAAWLALLGVAGIAIAWHGDDRLGAWWCGALNYLLIALLFVGERAYRRARGQVPAGLLAQARNVRRALRSPHA